MTAEKRRLQEENHNLKQDLSDVNVDRMDMEVELRHLTKGNAALKRESELLQTEVRSVVS